MAADYQQNSVAELLQQGITAASEKRKPEAQQLLREVLRREPNNEQGWLWLAAVAESPEEAMRHFQRVLTINPNNAQAQAGVRWAEARRTRTGPQTSGATATPSTPTPPATNIFNTGNIAGPEAFGLPTTTSSRPPDMDATFTPPAGVTSTPSRDANLDFAALQRVADARRNQEAAQDTPASRQGFFEISDEDETVAPVTSGTMLVDSTTLPTPPPRQALPDDYEDDFGGLDDLSNIDDSTVPAAPKREDTPAPRRERPINLARQLAMEGAVLDQKAGRLEGNPEDATSIEAAHTNAERRRMGQSTMATRAASPGLFGNPLLAGAALLIALLVGGWAVFSLLGSNTGSAPENTIKSFLSAYNKNQPAEYNKYLTSALQKQMSSDASIGQYLATYSKQLPAAADGSGLTATPLKIADDSIGGKARVEYHMLGQNKQPLLDVALEKNGNDWQIFNIGWVGGKLGTAANGLGNGKKKGRVRILAPFVCVISASTV